MRPAGDSLISGRRKTAAALASSRDGGGVGAGGGGRWGRGCDKPITCESSTSSPHCFADSRRSAASVGVKGRPDTCEVSVPPCVVTTPPCLCSDGSNSLISDALLT